MRKSSYQPPVYASKAVEEKVDLVTPSQAEELKLLKATASQEISVKVDGILVQKNIKNLKELPASGFDYIKDLLLKNQKPDFILGDGND